VFIDIDSIRKGEDELIYFTLGAPPDSESERWELFRYAYDCTTAMKFFPDRGRDWRNRGEAVDPKGKLFLFVCSPAQ
jgi:hypothetical protein